ALELVEELLHRIVVVIGALVRPADYLHGHVAVLEHLLVADRRLQQVLVFLDPGLEVEGVQTSVCHRSLLAPLTPPTSARLCGRARARRSRTAAAWPRAPRR